MSISVLILQPKLHNNDPQPSAAHKDAADPCWPQGFGNTFVNVGLERWKKQRSEWRKPKGQRRAPPPPVEYEAVMQGLSVRQRQYQLPGWMTLADLIDVYIDLWEMDY